MNTQSILLPHKHIRFCESLVGLAGFVRDLLAEPRTIDELWALIDRNNSGWPSRPAFEHLILAIDLLFAINQIQLVANNRIRRITNETD